MTASSRFCAVLAGVIVCWPLVACDQQTANAAGNGQAFEIRTQTRPESIEGYLQVYRGAHQVCAAAREQMKLHPAPPLIRLPADFVTERTLYLSSEGASLTRREKFAIDLAEMTPELGCKSRIVSTIAEELVRDGNIEASMRYEDGTVEVDPAQPVPPPEQVPAGVYSEKKHLAGHAMRCAPPAASLGPGVMQDVCVPDAGRDILVDGVGEPIVVHARSTLLEQGNNILLTEPVSIQVGKPVSLARFALSKE